ncbi:response regulator [Moorena producens]|uniref:response regulator n=1 Tax=Moorena producens TaxID=1155739 RepID=UPI003C783605
MFSCEHPALRVLVVDDHELTRYSLQLAFSAQENIEIVALASNGKEAIDMVECHRPDVIVLDLQMPMMDGLSAATRIKSLEPDTKIIAYSSVEDPQIEVMSQTAPVDIFCRKDVATSDLINLVRKMGRDKVNRLQPLAKIS